MPEQTTRIPWYEKQSYSSIQDLSQDGQNLPDTHRQWLAKAERTLALLRDAGCKAIPVQVDPVEFMTWCREQGREPNIRSRVDYCANRLAPARPSSEGDR